MTTKRARYMVRRKRYARELARIVRPPPPARFCATCKGLGKPPLGCPTCKRKRPVKFVRRVVWFKYHPKPITGVHSNPITKHQGRMFNDHIG